MIVCTKTMSTLLGSVVGGSKVATSSIQAIINSLHLSPEVSQLKAELNVVSNEDLRSKKIRDEFISKVGQRHPECKVIFYSKSPKLDKDIEAIAGELDKVIIKRKGNDLANDLYSVIQTIAVKDIDIQQAPDFIPQMPDDIPPQQVIPQQVVVEQPVEPVVEQPQPQLVVEPQPMPVPDTYVEPQPQPVIQDNVLLERLKTANKIASVQNIVSELNNAEVLKELAKSNNEYQVLEARIKGLNEKIYSIINDTSIISLEDKLNRIRAIFIDKDRSTANSHSIIEQYMEELILTITDRVKTLINERLEDLEKQLMSTAQASMTDPNARIVAINSERANLILDLSIMDKEVSNIYHITDKMIANMVKQMAEDNLHKTGNDMIDNRLSVSRDVVSSESVVDDIIKVLRENDKMSEAFEQGLADIKSFTNKLIKLADMDNEIVQAQKQIIEFLRLNDVEDKVIKETLLKKSVRVYTGREGVGTTIIPAFVSHIKSNGNNNVLCVNLTGHDKFKYYDIHTVDLVDMMEHIVTGKLTYVTANNCAIDYKVNDAQWRSEFIEQLQKWAEYYPVINLVMTFDQIKVFGDTMSEFLSINCITDMNAVNVDKTAEFLDSTRQLGDNMAIKVIVNKMIGDIAKVTEVLNIGDRIDMQIVTIPVLSVLETAMLKKINPFSCDSVYSTLEKVDGLV